MIAIETIGYGKRTRYGAWQRQLTDNAERAAMQVLGI